MKSWLSWVLHSCLGGVGVDGKDPEHKELNKIIADSGQGDVVVTPLEMWRIYFVIFIELFRADPFFLRV